MLKDIQPINEKETREGFGEGIHELGKSNGNVVVLTADLAGSLKLKPFIKDFPDKLEICFFRISYLLDIRNMAQGTP